MNLPDRANDLASILANVGNPSSPLLLLALAVTIIFGMALRGELSPHLMADLSLPFSRLTLAAVGFIALCAWAISG